MHDKIGHLLEIVGNEWHGYGKTKKALFISIGSLIILVIIHRTVLSRVQTIIVAKREIMQIQKQINVHKIDLAELPHIYQLGQKYKRTLDSLSVVFSNKADLTRLLPPANIHIKILEFKPQNFTRSEGFSRIELPIKFTGTYDDAISYFRYIDETKVAAEIEQLDMTSFPQSPSQTLAEMTLAVYLGPDADSTMVFSSVSDVQAFAESESDDKSLKPEQPIQFAGKTVENQRLANRTAASKKQKSLVVTGAWFGKKPKLVVNQKMIGEGESVDGWLLRKIDTTKSIAVFESDGIVKELPF